MKNAHHPVADLEVIHAIADFHHFARAIAGGDQPFAMGNRILAQRHR
jgi:hypothetical protein